MECARQGGQRSPPSCTSPTQEPHDQRRENPRRNARRSTGPRSRAGEATAARNSCRHGLTLPVLGDPSAARDVVALACRIAEAEIDFDRVRRAKLVLIAALDAERGDTRALLRLDRYEGHAFTRRRHPRIRRGHVRDAGGDPFAEKDKTKPTGKGQSF